MHIEKETKALKALLERAIPILATRRIENAKRYKESVIAPHRGERNWWFGKIKTDADLWMKYAMFAMLYVFDTKESEARRMLDACNLCDIIYVTCDSDDCIFLSRLTREFPELAEPIEVFKAIP